MNRANIHGVYKAEAALAAEEFLSPANGDFDATRRASIARSRLLVTAALLLLILVGFGLRIFMLERQSMWSDEGLSYYRAGLSTAEVLRGLIVIDGVATRDTNPPLYFLLLHFWRNLTGDSIFALRYSGALAGTLAVPLLFVLGRAIYTRWVGIAAALLMAISPFHVWQSQVLRNYSLLVTLNLASVYGLFRFVLARRGEPRGRWLLLWLLAGLVGIYTHYFGFFVLAFGALTLLLAMLARWDIRHLLRQTWFWLGLLLGALLLLPAIAIGLERFTAGQQIDFHQIGLVPVLIHAASAFGVGIEPDLAHPYWRLLPALLLAAGGLLLGLRRRWSPTLILLGYQVIPIALMLLLSTINPLYNGVRHLLIGLPPYLLLVANGALGAFSIDRPASRKSLGRVLRWLALLLFLVVILFQLTWLRVQFTDDELLRDDIRGAAEYLNEFATQDDLIILHDTIIGLTFDYYYDGAAEWRAIPQLDQQDVAQAQAAMEAAGQEAQRVWFLARPTPRTGFPRKEVWDWADRNWPRFFDHEYPSMWLRVELVGYDPDPEFTSLPDHAIEIGETFGDQLTLYGADIPDSVQAGNPWWATLYWSKEADEIGQVNLSLRFIDQQGQVWAQDDEILWHDYPPDDWPADSLIGSPWEVVVPSGVPPGPYEVWLRVMDAERDPMRGESGQTDILLTEIDLTAGTDFAGLPPIAQQRTRLGDLDFLGYLLPEEGIKPGHAIPLELFWYARQKPAEEYALRLEIVDPSGEVIGTADEPLTRADYPSSRWEKGELLQSKILLNMPASADETLHAIRVNLVRSESGEVVDSLTLRDKVSVDPWPYVGEVPPAIEPLDAQFGDPRAIALRGYELASTELKPGEVLDLTLYWQAYRDISEPYYVFLHLMDQDGAIAAQVDRAPVQGFRPTVSWREGEVIVDNYGLPLPIDLEAGQYELWVGLYNPDTGQRPPTTVGDQLTADNRVYVAEITVGQQE